MVERRSEEPGVGGSIPPRPTSISRRELTALALFPKQLV